MESLYLLVPLSVALVFLIGWAFWRALEGGQFDDLERPAHDILADDDRPRNRGQSPIRQSGSEPD
jgi:cbb3-type cytochrome oxidase maturation protein